MKVIADGTFTIDTGINLPSAISPCGLMLVGVSGSSASSFFSTQCRPFDDAANQYNILTPEYSCKIKVNAANPTIFWTYVGTSSMNCRMIPKKQTPNKMGVFHP